MFQRRDQNPIWNLSATSSSSYAGNTALFGPQLAIDGIVVHIQTYFWHSNSSPYQWLQVKTRYKNVFRWLDALPLFFVPLT